MWWPVSISGFQVLVLPATTLSSIDLLIHHTPIITHHQNYVNTLSKMILHIQAAIYAILQILTFG